MKKLFFFLTAMLVAITVNAQTDFSTPYSCAADDATLSGTAAANKFFLNTESDPHTIVWYDVAYGIAVASWKVTATKGCYVSVSLDLGSYNNNKHIFEVKILKGSTERGTVAEGPADESGATDGYNQDYDKVKPLEGTILLPDAGEYTIELRNNRGYGKGAVKNVILTYAAEAPAEIIEVSSVELNKTELALQVDEVEQLTATVLPENATTKTVTWESTDESVATVDGGFITALKAGTTTIKAKAGEKEATCAVTVAAAAVPEVKLTSTYTLAAKVAHLEGKVWKKYDDEKYKIYGDGGHNKKYGNALWTINITNPCIISASVMDLGGGALYELDVFQGEDSITTVIQPKSSQWWSGVVDMTGTMTLSKAGEYTFRLRNALEWSSGKTSGIMLNYVSELPKTLYLKLSSDWAGWPAKYAIYYFDNSTNGWSDFMTEVEGEEDTYTATIPGEYADDKIIFVRFNSTKESTGNWDDKWSQTVNLDIPSGKDFFTVTSGGTGDACDGVWHKLHPALANGFYLVGLFNNVEEWDYADLSAAKKFAATESEGEYSITVNLVDGDKFKAIYLEDDGYQTWYPAGSDNEYVVTSIVAGENKTIYFRPTYHEAWSGHFYIEPNSTTALDNANANAKAVKSIVNGQLLITRDGKTYNVLGTIVK